MIKEELIKFIWDCKYLTLSQKIELEMDIKYNRRCNRIFEDIDIDKEVQIEKLEGEIEKLERELAEFEPFRGIKDAVEDFVVEMKMKRR